jgi:hypothetical protein
MRVAGEEAAKKGRAQQGYGQHEGVDVRFVFHDWDGMRVNEWGMI